MIEQITTNGRERPLLDHSPRFLEIQEALRLEGVIEARIEELTQAEQETAAHFEEVRVRLIVIRTMLADYREQLGKAAHPIPPTPPT